MRLLSLSHYFVSKEGAFSLASFFPSQCCSVVRYATNPDNLGDLLGSFRASRYLFLARRMLMTSPASTSTSLAVLPTVLNQVNVVGAAWMASSALLTTYSTNKFLKYSPVENLAKKDIESNVVEINRTNSILHRLSRASLLTLLRFGGSLMLGLIAHPDFQILERIQETLRLVPDFALPALFLYIANYANSIALHRIGISLTYVVKCAIPAITVAITLVLDGTSALPRLPVLLTLVPIAAGIAAASWNHPTFEKFGFAAAMLSSTAQSALNVSTKKIMSNVGVSGPVAQRSMVAAGLAFAAAVSAAQLFRSDDSTEKNPFPPLWLGVMATTAYHIEYVLSFIFVKLVAPISYGACDAVRRLSIIVSGHFMFGGEPFTKVNIGGIALALVGALLYSILNSI